MASFAGKGAAGSYGLDDLAAKLPAPRAVWLMLPAGKVTEDAVTELHGVLQSGDIVIDGGNTFYKDDVRRARELKTKDIHYVDVGTSGGIWGLDRGYCLMIGGEPEVVALLDPIFSALAPGLGNIERTAGRDGRDKRPERGYMHCGPCGSGHFVKMIHNGIEYGLMQAYAEGFAILKGAASSERSPDERYDLDVADIAEVWRRGSVISSWLLDLTAIALAGDPEARRIFRRRRGFRRGPLDGDGGDRGGGAGDRALGGALCALSLARRPRFCRPAAVGNAQGIWGTYRTEEIAEHGRRRARTSLPSPAARRAAPIPAPSSFSAPRGDLTKRLLLPALYNLAAGGLLSDAFAIVGVARADGSDDEFRRRMRAALQKFATAEIRPETLDDLIGRCRYVRGDFDDPSTYGRVKDRTRRDRTHAEQARQLPVLSGDAAGFVCSYCASARSSRASPTRRTGVGGGSSSKSHSASTSYRPAR